jgi:lysozyme family protein
MIETGRHAHAAVVNALAKQGTAMNANFDQALAFTLEFEGGYCDVPGDPGGPTCWGITLATFCHELGRPASVTELKHISSETVAAIYRKRYWNAINADSLPPGVDLMLFDVSVNMGPGRALQWEHQTANMAPVARINRLDQLRLGFWKRLAIWAKFGRGWARREVACKATALKMAGA